MIVLIALIILVLAAPAVYRQFRKDNKIDPNTLNSAVAALEKVDNKAANDSLAGGTNRGKTYPHIEKLKAGETIEINTADSAALVKLSGIGPAYAMRIIHYRERLGGYIRKEQLLEVFGMDADRYDALKNNVTVNPKLIRRLHINTIPFDSLKRFPYLSYKQMNAVIQYREQHGNYEHFADLRAVAILDEGILRKIEPYISFK